MLKQFFLILALFFSLPLKAERYVLFTAPGVQAPHYARIKFKVGDVLVFSNGKEFEIKGILGKGNTTLILDIGGRRALRIPLSSGNASLFVGPDKYAFRYDLGPYTSFITEFIKGVKALSASGGRVVEMYDYLEEEYAVVERLYRRFDLQWYLENRGFIDPPVRKVIDLKLLDWVRSIAMVAGIGDFTESQLIYVEGEWVLDDLTSRVVSAKYQNDLSPFLIGRWEKFLKIVGRTRGVWVPPDLEAEIKAVIREIRKDSGLRWAWHYPCTQTLDVISYVVGSARQREKNLQKVP